MVPTKRGLESSSGGLVYARGTTRGSQAQVVEVHGSEQHARVDIAIPVAGLHRVTGRVVASTGAVVDSGLVRLYPTGEPGLSLSTPLRVDGSFSFNGVADEAYTVAVEFEGRTEFVGVTEDKTGVRMRMKKAPYASVSRDVGVAGEDPAPVTLVTTPAF